MVAWSPLGGTEWLPDWVLDEALPENPVTVPGRNGLPKPVPYRYQGNDFDDLLSTRAAVGALQRRKPPRKPGPPAIDPGGPDVPFSAPREWLRELAQETS
jgi:hypothetical protein